MQLIAPTKEQIISGIVNPFVLILSYALSFIKERETVNEVLAEVKAAVDGIDVNAAYTTEQAVRSGLQIAETLADTTPTQVDDSVVDAAKLGADFVFKRGAAFSTLVNLLKLRKKAKQQADVDSVS